MIWVQTVCKGYQQMTKDSTFHTRVAHAWSLCMLFLTIFFNIIFFSKKKKILTVSNSRDPDQAQHSVQPDLGLNCLQRLSADNILPQLAYSGNNFTAVITMNILMKNSFANSLDSNQARKHVICLIWLKKSWKSDSIPKLFFLKTLW